MGSDSIKKDRFNDNVKEGKGELTFEEALNELEAIVKLMEEGNLDLEDALTKFENGISLSRICNKKLEQAEKKIDMLLSNEKGETIVESIVIVEEENE